MSIPMQNPPQFIDPANTMLAQVPARMDAGTIEIPGGVGTVAVVTIRTASTTLSIVLDKKDLASWGKILVDLAASMGTTKIALPSQAEISAVNRNNGRP